MSSMCLGRIYYVYVYTMRLILIQRLTVFDDSHILVTTRVVQVFMRVRSNSCFLWVTISFFVSYVFLRNRKKTKTNYLTTKMKRKNAHLSLCVVKCLMLEIFKLWTDFLQEKNWQKLEEITKHNYVTAHTLIYYLLLRNGNNHTLTVNIYLQKFIMIRLRDYKRKCHSYFGNHKNLFKDVT